VNESTERSDQLITEQRQIDARRNAMAEEIIAEQRVTSLEEALQLARSWIVTAAQHAANEDYYRGERDKLLRVIETANNQLFDSVVDVEHQITYHADTLPEAFRRLAAGHASAFETLQTVIGELVLAEELSHPISLGGAFSEDLHNADGSLVTVEQAMERNRE
jgi:hypothetical protein